MANTCEICNKTFSRRDSLNRHVKRMHGINGEDSDKTSTDDDEDMEDDSVDEEAVDSGHGDTEDEDEEEDEEGYVECVIKDIFDKHEGVLQDHVPDPDTLDEYSKNKTVEDFLRDKIISKFADDFHTLVSWNSLDVTQRWARQARKHMAEDNINAVSAMKRVLYRDQIIKELIIEELNDSENEDEDEDETDIY